MTTQKIVTAIELYERNRDGVNALHESRYVDVAEYLEIAFRKELYQKELELLNKYSERIGLDAEERIEELKQILK